MQVSFLLFCGFISYPSFLKLILIIQLKQWKPDHDSVWISDQPGLLHGVEDVGHVTVEHHLTNVLFLLFSSFFWSFVLYCFMSTVSSIPRASTWLADFYNLISPLSSVLVSAEKVIASRAGGFCPSLPDGCLREVSWGTFYGNSTYRLKYCKRQTS